MSRAKSRALVVRCILRNFKAVETEGLADLAVNHLFDLLSVEGWGPDRLRPVVACLATQATDEDIDTIAQWAEDEERNARFWKAERAQINQLSELLRIDEDAADVLMREYRLKDSAKVRQ